MGFYFSSLFLCANATIQVYIDELGHSKYKVREQATKHLIAIVQSDEGHLFFSQLEAATQNPDIEIAARAMIVFLHYARPANYHATPWIDMLPEKLDNRWKPIREYLDQVHRCGIEADGHPWWSDYRYATQLYIFDLLRAGWSSGRVQQLLREMEENERAYVASRKW